jgi:hypothetical protein
VGMLIGRLFSALISTWPRRARAGTETFMLGGVRRAKHQPSPRGVPSTVVVGQNRSQNEGAGVIVMRVHSIDTRPRRCASEHNYIGAPNLDVGAFKTESLPAADLRAWSASDLHVAPSALRPP